MSVADIGCGLGTYAILAARAGAERVYGVDETGVIEIAREIAAANGCADRVKLLSGRSTEIDPPERVDLAIFEDYVAGLLTPSIVAVLRDLRTRWLKPGGRLLPAQARLWAAPVEARELHQSLDRFSGTGERVFGIDLGPARRRAFATPQMVNLRAAALLTAPQGGETIDLASVETAQLRWRSTAPVTRDALVHGLLVWFDLALGDAHLGTGPLDPPSAWRQVFLPFETPLQAREADELALEVEVAPFGDAMMWRWRASGPRGSVTAHSLDATVLSAEARHGARIDRVPTRSVELEIDAAVLAEIDGKRSASAIAAVVHERFPERFSTRREAEARTTRVLARYGATATAD